MSAYFTRLPVGSAFVRWYRKWIDLGFLDHYIAHSQRVVKELHLASRGHVHERGIRVRPPAWTFSVGHRGPTRGATAFARPSGALCRAPAENLDLFAHAIAGRFLHPGHSAEREQLARLHAGLIGLLRSSPRLQDPVFAARRTAKRFQARRIFRNPDFLLTPGSWLGAEL